MKKILNKKIILCLTLIITIFFNIVSVVNADSTNEMIWIKNKGMNQSLLYKNRQAVINLNYVSKEGNYPMYNAIYPKYMYNPVDYKENVEEGSYLWKVAINGYPYNKFEKIEGITDEEAYVATQAAIYCAKCDHLPSDYSYIMGNESSKRIYDAFIDILDKAEKCNLSIPENKVIKLVEEQNDWQIDGENLYKTYNIKSNCKIGKYIVETLNLDNVSIKDMDNISRSEFSLEESFKVVIPISELYKSGELKINIKADVETYPIYLAKSEQNQYVLTGDIYEEIEEEFSENYQENITSININVKEADTKIGIENSIINLLDSNKELISSFTTNEQGKIFIEHLLPGTYYIEQETTEDGYKIYSKPVQLNMEYSKVLNLNINNAKENIQNIVSKEESITITEESTQKNINNEYTNTVINNKTETAIENNTNNSYEENNNTVQNSVNNKDTSTKINNNNNQNILNNEKDYTIVNNNKNTVNKNYIENNSSINNSNTSYISSNLETVKTLPKTGM